MQSKNFQESSKTSKGLKNFSEALGVLVSGLAAVVVTGKG